MSTTPIPVQTLKPPTPVAISVFLKRHETLILSLTVLAVVFFVHNKAINYIASRDSLANNKPQAALQSQIDEKKQNADATAQVILQYKDLVKQLAASNVQLVANMQQRTQVTQKQQIVDKTLPPPELAVRWSAMLKMPSGVVPSDGG